VTAGDSGRRDQSASAMPDPRGHPAYFVRYGVWYVAWFCEPDAPEAFLEWNSEPHEDHVHSYLAAIGCAPEPGHTYTDVGHEHCLGVDCPDDASTGDQHV
jgi:hypothetical protein